MGDRCYMEINLKREDFPAFEEEFGEGAWTIEQEDGQILKCSMEEANYACSEELQTLASRGIVFTGWHGEGDQYGPNRFVAFEDDIFYCATDHCDNLVFTVGDAGDINLLALMTVLQFITKFQIVSEMFDDLKDDGSEEEEESNDDEEILRSYTVGGYFKDNLQLWEENVSAATAEEAMKLGAAQILDRNQDYVTIEDVIITNVVVGCHDSEISSDTVVCAKDILDIEEKEGEGDDVAD